jgi:hypothetical protein
MRDKITEKLKASIAALERDVVFIANDFLDIAGYDTICRALNRLANSGMIKRVLRGV